MTQLVVVEGYLADDKSDPAEVLLADGMTILINRGGIQKQVAADTSSTPLMRLFLDPEADVILRFKAKEFLAGSAIPGSTILKWMDDGGTIRKSLDDTRSAGTITKWLDDGGTISKSRDDGF